jgi:uracil-DNA glycosylase
MDGLSQARCISKGDFRSALILPFACSRDGLYNREVTPPVADSPLALLNARVVACQRCPRLRAHCLAVAQKKRRAYADFDYWAKPVPSFGDPNARVLFVGLAPGAHGSNRTGRPFTGDGSGDFLYPLLHRAGFASQAHAQHRGDGLRLFGAWITAVVRCAPPGNKPLPGEIAACAPYLDEEIAALPSVRVIVCLGKIGFDGVVAHLLRSGQIARRGGLVFGHGVEYRIPGNRWLLASYHPSLQNTNTGKLTAPMMLKVFRRARQLAMIFTDPVGAQTAREIAPPAGHLLRGRGASRG